MIEPSNTDIASCPDNVQYYIQELQDELDNTNTAFGEVATALGLSTWGYPEVAVVAADILVDNRLKDGEIGSLTLWITSLKRKIALLENRIILEDEICNIFQTEAQRIVDLP